MRCKVGDLAIYVGKGSPKDAGAIVLCVKFLGVKLTYLGDSAPMWEVEPPLKYSNVTKHWIADRSLRPIRDNPGQDETLQWAPHKETA